MFTAQLATNPFLDEESEPATARRLLADFEAALQHTSFPSAILEEGIAALSAPFSSVDPPNTAEGGDLQAEIQLLRAQLTHSRAAQLAHAERAVEVGTELLRMQDEAKAKKRAKWVKRVRRAKAEEVQRKKYMGEKVESEDERIGRGGEDERTGGGDEDEEVSSTTEDMDESE